MNFNTLAKRCFSKIPSSTLNKIKDVYKIKDTSLDRYLTEQLIIVDEQDAEIGSTSLLEGHLTEKIFGENLTHRAFSLLLFDEDFNLLLQRRSSSKIAFPGYWGNSCCSHPLSSEPGENNESNNIGN